MNTVDFRGDLEVMAEIINNEYVGEFVDDTFTSVGQNLFRDCTKLTKVTLPNATSIGQYAFVNSGISEIAENDLPKVTSIGTGAFQSCNNLNENAFRMPKVTSISNSAFASCTGFTRIIKEMFGNLTTIGRSAFSGMTNVKMVYLPSITDIGTDTFGLLPLSSKTKVLRLPNAKTISGGNLGLSIAALKLIDIAPTYSLGGSELGMTSAAYNTLILRTPTLVPLTSTTGKFVTVSNFKSGGSGVDVYVPAALVEDYKSATNWSVLVDDYKTARFHAIEGSIYEDPDYDYDIGMED